MNTNLALCLALQRAHASLRLKLDDELGVYHGIGFSDFVLLSPHCRTGTPARSASVSGAASVDCARKDWSRCARWSER
jgi:hypothetical protein